MKLSSIKSNTSSVLQKILIAINTNAYKNRYLKQYINLSWKNYREDKAEYEMLLLPYFLNRDSVFFDIGSNIGSFILIADKTINQSNIYAFEPIPMLNKRLKILFPKVNVREIALSNFKNKTQFKIPKINSVNFLTRGTLNTNFVETNESGYTLLKVQTNTLDNFCSEERINRIDLIKIDVEGHEYEVIQGAINTFRIFHPILIIEIEQRHHTQDISMIIGEITKLQYTCLYFDNTTCQIKELLVDPKNLQDPTHFEKSRNYVHNFIFIPTAKVEAGYINLINEKITSDRRR